MYQHLHTHTHTHTHPHITTYTNTYTSRKPNPLTRQRSLMRTNPYLGSQCYLAASPGTNGNTPTSTVSPLAAGTGQQRITPAAGITDIATGVYRSSNATGHAVDDMVVEYETQVSTTSHPSLSHRGLGW